MQSFTTEVEIKTFYYTLKKKKRKEFMNTKPMLKIYLKGSYTKKRKINAIMKI
jgi:hypothetical protein